MLNDGCGLCVKLDTDGKGRALFVKCDKVGDDVIVRDCPTPFVVATEDTETSWSWGHYFENLDDAMDFLRTNMV